MRTSYAPINTYEHTTSSYKNKPFSKSYKNYNDYSKKNNYNTNLELENADLKKQLHELRKMEAGWFGKNKNYVKKEVIV